MAVFTPVSLDEARQYLRDYDLGAVRALHPIAEGVENTNYRLETERGRHVLTLFERRTDAASLPFCLGLTSHLAAHGFPAPRPVARRSGGWIGTLNGRPAAVIEWLDGAWTPRPLLSQIEAAGALLARLHRLAADFPLKRDDPVGLAARNTLALRCAQRATGEARAMLDVLEQELDVHARDDLSAMPRGPIHADFFPDNILFHRGRPSGVIDFYFGHVGALAYDLATALNAWAFDADGRPLPGAAAAMTRGYEKVRPLTSAERAALPALGAASAVRFTLTRLHDRLFHDPEWLVTPKDPRPFFNRIAFHRTAVPADYGMRAA